jgi:hypothetical protein
MQGKGSIQCGYNHEGSEGVDEVLRVLLLLPIVAFMLLLLLVVVAVAVERKKSPAVKLPLIGGDDNGGVTGVVARGVAEDDARDRPFVGVDDGDDDDAVVVVVTLACEGATCTFDNDGDDEPTDVT